MSLKPHRPSSHRGSFTDEIETARSDLQRNLLAGESAAGTPSVSGESPPPLSSAASGSPSSLSPVTPTAEDNQVADSFAFAFDIDGVLVRGGKAIPEAVEAMRLLNGDNEHGIKM